MKTEDNFKQLIKLLSKDNQTYISTGIARNINVDERTCDIDIEDDLTLFNCRLNSVLSDYKNQLLVTPTEGSAVTFAALDGELTEVVVIGYSEIDNMNICIGEMSMNINKDGVVFNEGSETIANANELQKQLNTMSARIDGIINAIKGATSIPQDGGAGLKTSMTALLPEVSENFDNIIDDAIKH